MAPKQKIVIKVTMPNAKRRAHAMALAVKASGVSSVGITGDDRLEVGGEGIDVVCLVNRLRENLCIVKCLRKKICHAEILTVEEVKDKKPEEPKKKPEEKPEPKPCTCPVGPCRCAGYYPSPMVFCETEPPAGTCHIM